MNTKPICRGRATGVSSPYATMKISAAIGSYQVSTHFQPNYSQHAFFKRIWMDKKQMNKASRLFIFASKGQMSDFQCFFRPVGAQKGQRGQTNIWFALWLRGRNTSQADSQGIQNQTDALGVFIQKTSLFKSDNLSSKLQFNSRFWGRNEKWKDVLVIYFSWDFSLSRDVLHRCPCLLWALLVNKTRLSLTDLLLALKAVYYISVCVWFSEGAVCV